MADDPLDKYHYLRRISADEAIDGLGKHYDVSVKDDGGLEPPIVIKVVIEFSLSLTIYICFGQPILTAVEQAIDTLFPSRFSANCVTTTLPYDSHCDRLNSAYLD